MTPTVYTLTRARLERVLEMLDREARGADAAFAKYGDHWDSYSQGVKFAVLEIRAAMRMEESDED